MPHIVFRGVSPEQVKNISKPLVNELAHICECGTDNFTFEVVHSTFVFDGEEVPAFPFLEVKWFDRGQTIRNKVAVAITNHLHTLNIPEVEIAFLPLSEQAYYISGTDCSS